MPSDAFELVTRNTEEVVTEGDLEDALDRGEPAAYIGFEPSGTAHLGWLICARKIRDLQEAGFEVTILLADWHAQINDKLDGDLERIQACGRYMEEAMEALGVREDANFVYASDWVADPDYWATVLRVGKSSTLNRIKRAMTIMGREAEDADLDYGKTIYPAMQVADIYYGDFDVALGGMDQRHAHMLARDVASKLDGEPPVAIHTPLLPGLTEAGARMDPTEAKMSKSEPETGVFLHDEPGEVEAKIEDAYCPGGQVEDNPVLALLEMVIWPEIEDAFVVERPEEYGGDLVFETFDEVEAAFDDGELHPLDLKQAVGAELNAVLDQVREHFEANPEGIEALDEALER
ncbi:tyrosine--tRNA ligase [Thermoplasmatales archaeon SW_10_69_26]|nr:MAG: tyrosine--tRNA ligase [Thermoplasmatales archaeon SW_10_69_26]